MKLQTRDKELLGAVLKYGLLSTQQIGELFFKDLHHTTLMRRLRILEKEKLILRIDALPNHQSAWSLGADGAKILGVEPPGRFTNRNTTLHDVTVSEVRITLEKIGLCQDFTSEMEMKKRINWKIGSTEKEFMQVPDGIFTATAKGNDVSSVVAMEVELHPKNHARYRKIMRHYLQNQSIQYVWYFVKTKGIANTIHKEWRSLKGQDSSQGLLFTELGEANKNPETITVYSTHDGKWLKFCDRFNLPNRDENSLHSTDHGVGKKNGAELGNKAA